MTNCKLGHMFYETHTPFNHVYYLAQTLSFSPIVHRVQDYIGSHADKTVISTVCLVQGLRWIMWEARWSLKLA